MYFLHFFAIPIGIAVAFVLVAASIRIIMWKNPKFDRWVGEIWPNPTQKSAIVTVAVIGIVIWFIVKD